MWQFIIQRWQDIAYRGFQHASLVVQSVAISLVIAVALAVLVTSVPALKPVANAITSVGLTIPSFALLGLVLPLVGIGTAPSIIIVTFYAVLPILRNAVTGLSQVDPRLVESSRGMGMSRWRTFGLVQLPLAWPVILTGLRVSTQMSMGVAAIAAYALGPGLGGYIYTGLSQIGGRNAVNYAVVGTLGIVLLSLVLDAGLQLIGRFTIPKGIRA